MRDLTRELRVGTCCGKCLPEAKTALATCLARSRVTGTVFAPSPAPEFAT